MSDGVIVLTAKKYFTSSQLAHIKEFADKQLKTGLVVVPYGFEVTVVNEDALNCKIEIQEYEK